MLRFFSNGTITESKLITGIKLQDNHDHLNPKNITVTQFKGATVVDPNLGNYVVLDFTVTDAAALDIDHIILMNDEQPVADSADKNLRIVKEAGKNLKIRLAAQFDGAEHCKFNTTSVNLPYATSFRDGVVRFANVTTNYGDTGWNITDNEENKSGTVYSADVVDKKISQVTSSLGNLNQYAKINAENTFAENNTFTKNVIVNGEISGEAVATLGMNGEPTNAMVVSVGYANDKYLSKEIAAATYLTKNDAGTLYLTKTEAGTTYLTKSDASTTYLTQADANAAAANYAKLDVGNTFTGDVNTFKEVNATKFSGAGVVDAITSNTLDDAAFIPTDGAVKKYVDSKTGTLTQNITTLQEKDNDLQSQIDGINAGQNLADIVNNTTELAGYDVSHLKAKGDSLPGKPSDTWAIGDKVQVLGGGDVQSSVYELIKGTKPTGEESKDIQSTNNTAYYWHYIGVYGTNAYTKAEIDNKVIEINTNIGKKADTTYVNDELDKKVDKTQIITTIDDGTATATNVTSGSAVKTYVDTVANGLPNKYVTLDTAQEITGAKTFANGNITIANPNAAHKDKHYVWVRASGDNTTGDYTSSVEHYDLTHNDAASDQFMRPRGDGDNVFHTNDLTRFSPSGEVQQYTKLEQRINHRYSYNASDIYMSTSLVDMKVAQIGTPGNTSSTDDSLKENYVERIRLRKNTSTATDTAGGFLPAGQSVTDIDLFADNINNVFNNEVSFRVCTTSGAGVKTDTSVLKINGSGIHYHTQDVNSLSTTEYQLRTAGSLDFETSITQNADDSHLPTSLAVKNYVATTVDAKITDAFVKTSAQGTNQTIDSAITVTEGITVGTSNKAANLDVTGIITGNAVETQTINPDGTKLPTEHAVSQLVVNAIAENKNDTSDTSKVGAMGLFLYTGNDLKLMGEYVLGTSLQAVGMQLPMDGVVSWSQGESMPANSTWKLLNNTIAGEPCLVLAIRTA